MNLIPYPDASNGYLADHVDLIVENFRSLLGRDLLGKHEQQQSMPEQLFYAPFALLSHDTSEDPLFNYANRTAMSLFEMEWAELQTIPSRYSAEPVNREARERLLKQVTEKGFIDDYEGIRISKTGKRFLIKQAVVWNLHDLEGKYRGQAACFSIWDYLGNN